MAQELIDLLWREHPLAPRGGARGPRAKVTTSQAVDAAIALADAEGLDAVTARRLAADLGISAMAVYTHVGSLEDLRVLMLDTACARHRPALYADEGWRGRVRQVAKSELDLYSGHWWILDIADQRTALGPGTIAKYDHELRAFDGAGLSDIDRDAALTFVLDFARSSAQARRPDPRAADMAAAWSAWGPRLAAYLGDDYPLAQRVGAAAGEAMDAAYSPAAAWEFGLARVLDALRAVIG
ncbi:TetR/AcrR family transcriptional regulator [Tomitella biformata]|uniref:TetR/AcrR family transcriptional regulator n=1 Tax=Tomitella biformata TaxID=630403 RepID=UPI0004635851|nr:TetR/AcrR family transcriptional regulator C-terminal domain-containing protein [Tomitella biformata]